VSPRFVLFIVITNCAQSTPFNTKKRKSVLCGALSLKCTVFIIPYFLYCNCTKTHRLVKITNPVNNAISPHFILLLNYLTETSCTNNQRHELNSHSLFHTFFAVAIFLYYKSVDNTPKVQIFWKNTNRWNDLYFPICYWKTLILTFREL
jgi:hypothetical protein